MAGIYVHIPFCTRKCLYCDFYSVGARRAPFAEYIDVLIDEARARLGELGGEKIETLYIGGGTPSLLPAAEMTRLATELLRVAPDVREFTVEVNPDDVNAELIDTLLACGVNRVSMGVQTLSDDELSRVGRRHTAAQALEAYRLLRRVGNVSLDLMFGLPGQSLDSFSATLEQMIELSSEHISVYSLMWEPGTALSKMREQGRVQEAPEQLSLAMYSLLCERLASVGYEHYEVSNFARPGKASQHNSSYWSGTPYLGLGAGAHSYDGARLRRANISDVARYLNSRGTMCTTETLTDEELHDEYLLTRLRTCSGIDMQQYASLFGQSAATRLLARALRMGLEAKESRLAIPEERMMSLDSIIVELM